MSRAQAYGPQLPFDTSDGVNRRMEELYDVEDAVPDADGLIECAVLPLRDAVLYPNMVTPLFVSHDPTMLAVESSARAGRTMIALAQTDPELSDPSADDLYSTGTEVALGRAMQLPEGGVSVLTQGRRRVKIVEFLRGDPFLRATGATCR